MDLHHCSFVNSFSRSIFSNKLSLFSTGILAAEATFNVLHDGADMEMYWDSIKKSWIWEELYKARNYRPVSNAFDYNQA